MSSIFKGYFSCLGVDYQSLSLALVEELQKRHLSEFCFNSISVLLKRPISLDIEDILDKVVVHRQGGYCFEHNKLIYEALKSLGFNVRCLIAKVLNNQDVDSPRTHRITLLDWKGSQYLVDVGFGAFSPRGPIKVEEGVESIQGGQHYKVVVNADDDFQLELITKKAAHLGHAQPRIKRGLQSRAKETFRANLKIS